MIKIGNSDPKAFYIGSTPVKEIWKGGTKVWPYGIVTYIVDNFAFAYNIGQMLYVNQGNYATITARQRKYIDGDLEETTTVTMTPSRVSGTNRYTIASDGKIRFDIDNFGTTEFSQSTAVFKGTYSVGGETYTSQNFTVTLQGNTRSATSTREVQHQRIPGTSYRDYRNWYAYISATSYTSSSSRCPAKGGGTTLIISGSHEECTATPWTQDIDIYTTYTYTSERTKEEYTRTTQVSGTERTTWESKTDTLTPTMSAPSGGFTRSGNSVTIASEGTTPYASGRYATFSVSNGTASDSVTIYQDINKVESTSTREVRGTKQYGTATTEYRNWVATISATSYSSSSSRCPASGGGTTLIWSGSHQDRTATPWTQSVEVYTTYVYTSTASEEKKTDSRTDSGTDYTSWTTRTDTLTPTMSAPDGGFTRNGTVVTIASEGKTTYANGRTATFTVKNNTATQSVTIYQQYNVKTTTDAHYGNTVGITVGLSRDYLDCTGGNVTVSGTRQREWYAEAHSWTSGASDGGEMSYKYESITSWTSITVSPTATVSGTTITIDERKHNTESTVFTVTGNADGKSATATVERLGDSTYPGTQYTRSHYLQVEGAVNTISAAGGSRKYDISAGHTLVTPTYWRSDDKLYSEVTEQITDKWKYSKSGDGQSHYKNFNVTAGTESSAEYLSFDHDNMAKRVETDTIAISIVSAFDATANPFTETLAPVNRVETSTPETTTGFAINPISKVSSDGTGTNPIQIAGTRTFKTAYKKWTSGAEEGGATGTQNVNASSVAVNTTTYPWLHAVSGGKLTVDAYTATDADRTGVFSATYDGKTDSNVTITQKAREKQPIDYISFYYEPQSQYLNYLYIKNNASKAIDVNSYYYVIDGVTTTGNAANMHAGESRLIRGWNPNTQHLTDYGVTDATWH